MAGTLGLPEPLVEGRRVSGYFTAEFSRQGEAIWLCERAFYLARAFNCMILNFLDLHTVKTSYTARLCSRPGADLKQA
jgi:hypothetical protein